ncbi:MAG: hypothetical protein J6Q58_04315 [Clostridia bacterium]|nr:hypothetical protein [Clostridia bacterium]
MVKISAKLIKNHKTIKSYTYINVNEYCSDNFYEYLVEICRKLDISTPILIPYYIESFDNFNSVSFKSDDFIDKINFDSLLLENVDR